MGDWRKRGGWLRRRGEHHGSELIGYILGMSITPPSPVFWPVHVAIHLLRLEGKGLEQSLRFGCVWINVVFVL